jgi:hypothetical protein
MWLQKRNFYFTDFLPFGNSFSATPNKPLENCRRYKLRKSRLSKEIFVVMWRHLIARKQKLLYNQKESQLFNTYKYRILWTRFSLLRKRSKKWKWRVILSTKGNCVSKYGTLFPVFHLKMTIHVYFTTVDHSFLFWRTTCLLSLAKKKQVVL